MDDSATPFRSEALVSDGELRLEVAKAVVRNVGGNEQVLLRGGMRSHFFKDLLVSRGQNRTRVVHGDYHRESGKSDITMLDKGGDYSEVVAGGVHQHSTVEGESIVGGAYNANQVGPFLRLTAFCDFLAWGGWAEGDVVRVELCVLALRVYMGYAHATGQRTYMAGHLFDDWVNRVENFATFVDQQGQSTMLGGVGAVTQNEV